MMVSLSIFDWLFTVMRFCICISFVVQQQFHYLCMSILSSNVQRCPIGLVAGEGLYIYRLEKYVELVACCVLKRLTSKNVFTTQ